MKRTLTIISCLAALLLASCKEKAETPRAEISIEIVDVSVQNATLKVSCKGPNPALVRITDAIPKADFVEDPEFVKTNGFGISVPYSNAIKDLSPSTDYVVGAISFDSDMDMLTWGFAEFRTADLGSATVGDASGAGSLTNNELEDKE